MNQIYKKLAFTLCVFASLFVLLFAFIFGIFTVDATGVVVAITASTFVISIVIIACSYILYYRIKH